MNLSPAYLKRKEQWRVEGQTEIVESLLIGRFGMLDEELSNLIPAIVQLSNSERTQLLLNLSNFSREELLAQLR
ncbi:MAG: hypothetical protein SAL07_12530 [Oscillatoria sp. PMC 1051.18]|nr:hypothetical protein [Oscillatoria sp. PMC 1050.18]MEC5030715.1 hypothetical protein [Oscillatoria sp. PMC 1051.18]